MPKFPRNNEDRTHKPAALQKLVEASDIDLSSGTAEVFIPSGIAPLDEVILGAVAGELTVLAGQPGDGKTSLALQWALHAAADEDKQVGVISLEMNRRALRNRLISTLTGISSQTLRTRKWKGDEQERAIEAAEYLASLPLYVDDRSGQNGPMVQDTIRSWAAKGVDIIFVDYLQQLTSTNDSRVVQVGDAVRAIKDGARDADVPVVLISSLNRGAGQGGVPRNSWLRDSGDIEFVADTILMLHYPEDDAYEDVRNCDIHCTKQRNGPVAVSSVLFNRAETKFEEV